MIVPDYIKQAIEIAGDSFNIAKHLEKIIRDWIEEEGYEEDDTVLDQWIDCIECGANNSQILIEFLERYNNE